MPWVRQSDDVVEDPRTINAARHLGPNGIGRVVAMYTEVLGYCNRNLTDGYVDPVIAGRFRTDRRPVDVLTAMTFELRTGEAGWLKGNATDGWTVVDFSGQPSRAKVLAERAADAERKRVKRGGQPAPAVPAAALFDLTIKEWHRLPAVERSRLLAGASRTDFVESIKSLAAQAGVPDYHTQAHRAVDQVIRFRTRGA